MCNQCLENDFQQKVLVIIDETTKFKLIFCF